MKYRVVNNVVAASRYCRFGLVVFLCWLQLAVPGRGQSFQRAYGTASDEVINAGFQTTDGGYLMVGYRVSGGQRQVLAVKTDNAGALAWQNTYPVAGALTEARSVIQLADGTYAIAGIIQATAGGPDTRDILALRINNSGTLLGQVRIDGGSNFFDDTRYRSIAQLTNGNIVVVGTAASAAVAACAGNTCHDSFVALLDNNLNFITGNRITVSAGNIDFATSAAQNTNNRIIIVGRSSVGTNINAYALNLNQNTLVPQGAGVSFDNSNPAFNSEFFTSVLPLTGGGFQLSGSAGTNINGDALSFRLDANLNPVGNSARAFDYEATNCASNVANSDEGRARSFPTTDGGVVLATTTNGGGLGDDFYLIKLSATSTVEFARRIGGTGLDSLGGVVQTTDGGYALFGSTTSFGAGGRDVLLIKLNTQGVITCNGADVQACPTNLTFSPTLVNNPPTSPVATVPLTAPTQAAIALQSQDPCCANFSYTITANTVCLGQNTVFTITPGPVAGGTIEFDWDLNYNGTFVPDQTTTVGINPSLPVGSTPVRVIVRDVVNGCRDTVDVTAEVKPVPTITAPAGFSLCAGQTQTMTAALGTGIVGTYSWSPAANIQGSTNTATVTAQATAVAGTVTYTVVGTETLTGCTASATVTVTTNALPVANAGADFSVCENQSASLSSSGSTGTQFSWAPANLISGSPNVPNPTTLNLTAQTTFTLTVVDANGCTATDAVTVSVVTVNLATGPNVAFCANTPGTTLIANVPGVSGCTFEWRVQGDPAVFATTSSVTVTPAAATTYEVTVNCSGCTATRPILVTPQQPPAVNAEPDKTVCAGEQTTLTATGALTYTWQPGTNLTGNAILVTPAGPATTYTVTGTDLNGCTNTDVVTVTVNSLTSPNIPAVADICVGQSTQLNPAGVPQPDETYTWVPGSSLVGANTLNPTANPTVSTVYTLTIANTANGCSATSVVPLVVNPLPVATIVGDNFICANELKLYFATGGTSYEWLDAAGNIIGTNSNILINPLENTTFRVRATANGCTGLEVTKTIQVLPVPEPAIVVNNGVNLACESEPVIVQYTGIRVPNDVATWSFNGGSATNLGADSFGPYQVTWPQAGDYVISVQVQAGTCVASTASNFSIRTRPVVSTNSNLYYYCQGGGLANAPTIQGAVLNTGGGPCSYTWSPTTGLSNPFSLTPVAAPTQTTIYTLSATCKGCTGNTATVEVRVVPPPTVVVDTFVQTYCAGTKVDLLAIPEGLGPFSYEWSPTVGLSDFTAANPFANPTVSTVYCVTVTDRNGCKSAPTCVFVDVIPLPVANAGPDKQICLGSGLGVYLEGSGSSGGFGSVSYLWEPADYLSDPTDPNAYANPPTTTIYKLRAINTLTGCSSDATGLNDVYTVVVKVEDLPIVDAGPNASICFGESYSMKGAWLQGGTSPYTYFWEPTLGLTDPTNPLTEAKPNYTTKYFLKAKSAVGCVSLADSVTIEVLPRPTIRTTPNVSPTVCPGDSTQLFTQVTGAPLDGIRYSWVPTDGLSDPTAANPFASPQQTTTYTVTAYYDPDGNPLNGPGCQTSKPDTVRVQVFPTPTVNANPNNQRFVLCAATDAPIVLPATLTNITLQPYTLKWEPSAGLSDSTVLNPTAKPTESTDYTLTVTTGTCSVSSVVRVEVLTFVKAQIIASDDTVCAGNPVELVAIGGVGQARFTWILPDSTTREGARIVLNPTESGLYRVIITEGGCQDQADILITALINPTAGFTYTYAQGCRDLKVSFFDQSLLATQWRWDFGDGTAVSNVPNPVHEYARPGVYRVVLSVVSEDGCLQSLTAATDVVVSEPVNPDFTFSPSNSDGPIYLYTPIQFTDASVGAVRWQWSFGDGQASSVQNPEHLFKTPGAFSVRLVVIDNVGCTYEVEKPVIILPPLLNTPNVFTPNGDGVNDRWKPDYAGTETFDFRVFDRFGILVFTGNSTEGGWDGRFSNTDVPAGVYFYTFELNGRQYDGSFTLVR